MDVAVSQRLATAHRLLEAYGSLSADSMVENLDDSFQQQVLPVDLGMPSRNKEEMYGHAAGIFSVFSSFAMIPQAIYEDTAKNTVIIHAMMDGIMSKGPMAGKQYKNECILQIKFTEDGTKITEIKEFVDSHKARMMAQRVKPRGFMGPASAVGGVATYGVPVILAAAAALFYTGKLNHLRLR